MQVSVTEFFETYRIGIIEQIKTFCEGDNPRDLNIAYLEALARGRGIQSILNSVVSLINRKVVSPITSWYLTAYLDSCRGDHGRSMQMELLSQA